METPIEPRSPELPPSGATASPAGRPSAEVVAVQQSLNSLRFWFEVTLVILLVLVSGLDIYLLNQVLAIRREAATLSESVREMRQAVKDYESKNAPGMERFAAELYRFAEKHPDFAQVMVKYPRAAPPPRTTIAPASTPATTTNIAPPRRK
jgi:hypothetical protein